MRSCVLAALSLALVSSALSPAGADSFGVRTGYLHPWYTANGALLKFGGSYSVGAQYALRLDRRSSVRAAVDVFPVLYGVEGLGFGGELAYLLDLPALNVPEGLSLYAGAGLGAQFRTLNGVNLLAVSPTLIGGLNVQAGPNLAVFLELGAGYAFLNASGVNGSARAGGAFVQPRLGVTYTLR